ncbi:MAG TPA: PDZ domain-containing protein [Rudaea sp.]|nr:PDZ domain-containing protein [Rudaea sp.]
MLAKFFFGGLIAFAALAQAEDAPGGADRTGAAPEAVAAVAAREAAAQNAGDAEAQQRLREDLQQMLARLAASGALGPHPEQINLHLDQPAQRVATLGVLVDSASAERARNGLRVLGTTPGTTAERLGLRPGDVIVAVNGVSLRGLGADAHGHALAAAALRAVVETLPDSAALKLDVDRAGNALALEAPLQSVYLPALHMELGAAAMAGADVPGGGCGRISTFDVAPRGEHDYHARILLLDGVTPGPGNVENYRVAAGVHRLLVAENIPTEQIGVGEFATLRRKTSKELSVTVKPGITSMVAAQLHVDKASQLSNGGYWDPVVWREIPEACP